MAIVEMNNELSPVFVNVVDLGGCKREMAWAPKSRVVGERLTIGPVANAVVTL